MARVTATEVGEIIKVNANITPLTPFIDAAGQLVDDNCLTSSYSTAKLKMIELWLAAHFYAVRDSRAANEAAGSVSQALQYKVDLNLAVTTYGQQAMLIDSAGNLARLNAQATDGKAYKAVSVLWGGTAAT